MAQYFSIEANKQQLHGLARALAAAPREIDKILRGAVRDTSRQLRTRISSRIRERVMIKKKDIDKYIGILQYRNAARARVSLSESQRVSLKYFAARQNKVGATYKISKSAARQTAPGAFLVASLGGHVFRRLAGSKRRQPGGRYKGQLREKIARLHGPSPWAVFVMSGLEGPTAREAEELLENNLDRRTNLILLRLAGKVATPKYETN